MDKANITLLESFDNILSSIIDFSYPIRLIFAVIGALINIFHLLVLTRKSMRTSSINMIMIGVGLSDLYNTVCIVLQNYATKELYSECHPFGGPLSFLITFETTKSFDSIFRRLSAYLAVAMASVRLISIKTLLNPKFSQISKPFFGLKAVLILFLVSFLIDFFQYSRYNYVETPTGYVAPEHCGYPENHTVNMYRFVRNPYFHREFDLGIYLMMLGLSNLIPAISLPIISFLLIIEVNRAKDHLKQFGTSQQQSLENQKSDHTTRMIIYMTIASVAAEGPIGIFSVISSFLDDYSMTYKILWHLQLVFALLVVFNTTTHCLVSLAISSQYKEAALSMIPCRKTIPKSVKIINVEPSNLPSRQTIKSVQS